MSDFREVQNTPKWTASGTLAYATPIGDGDLSFGTTLSYRSKTYQFEIPNPYIDQKGFALLDASIVYTAPDDRWSIGLFGKNLTDKEYKTSGYTFINVNPTTGVPIARRQRPADLGARHRRHADRLLRQSAPGVRDRHGEVLSH